jgi:methylphosphotriester-DNA--protein-cysteine methyltransferase
MGRAIVLNAEPARFDGEAAPVACSAGHVGDAGSPLEGRRSGSVVKYVALYNRPHLQQVANTTPGEVFTQIRMATAAKLVGESRMSVGLIAEQVGYQSEAAFNRVSKLHYSTGPGAYRREAKARCERT